MLDRCLQKLQDIFDRECAEHRRGCADIVRMISGERLLHVGKVAPSVPRGEQLLARARIALVYDDLCVFPASCSRRFAVIAHKSPDAPAPTIAIILFAIRFPPLLSFTWILHKTHWADIKRKPAVFGSKLRFTLC